MNETVLIEARFDPKVKVYWYFQGLMVHAALTLAIIGVVSFPVWVVLGWFIVSKRYEHMSAQLTQRSIHLKTGYLFRSEKTVPLEKIQDLALKTGPLLDAFGLASVQIETAGGSAQQGSDMTLAGLVDAQAFRNAVLTQRERVSGVGPVVARSEDPTVALLTEIRDSLGRIEAHLRKE